VAFLKIVLLSRCLGLVRCGKKRDMKSSSSAIVDIFFKHFVIFVTSPMTTVAVIRARPIRMIMPWYCFLRYAHCPL